jgi:hypothetical protein
MKIPGIVWTTLLVFLPLAAGYITQFFGDFPWAGAVAGLLTLLAVGIAKVMAELKGTEPEPPAGVSLGDGGGVAQDSLMRRVLLG